MTSAGLETRTDVLSILRRGELWFRNAFVVAPALAAYEAAARAAPEDPLVLQTLADRAVYLGFPELAIPALEKAGPGFELSLAEAWHDVGEAKLASAWVDRALAEDPYNLHALNWKQYPRRAARQRPGEGNGAGPGPPGPLKPERKQANPVGSGSIRSGRASIPIRR